MPRAKMSITIPDEMLNEVKKEAAKRNTKLSHLVAEAITDKLNALKAEDFVNQINRVFSDPELSDEQRSIAEDIATHTDIEELPW